MGLVVARAVLVVLLVFAVAPEQLGAAGCPTFHDDKVQTVLYNVMYYSTNFMGSLHSYLPNQPLSLLLQYPSLWWLY